MLAAHDVQCKPRTAIKSQILADFFVDWAETQYLPPAPDSSHWRMHFDGSKMRGGLGAGIVLTSPKGDRLEYALQIHFKASNNVAEYEALVHGSGLPRRWASCESFASATRIWWCSKSREIGMRRMQIWPPTSSSSNSSVPAS